MENKKAHTLVALRKQIGGTTYVVRVYFNEDAKKAMKDKIKRMLENDVKMSQNAACCNEISELLKGSNL